MTSLRLRLKPSRTWRNAAPLSLLGGLTVLAFCEASGLEPRDYAVTVTAKSAAGGIELSWDADPTAQSYNVSRKMPAETSWISLTDQPGSSVGFVDATASTGVVYEYGVRRSGTRTGNGYVSAGVDVAATESRGKVLVLVDDTLAAPVSAELSTFLRDLVGDGWLPVRMDVSRSASVPSVKQLIRQEYDRDPPALRSVILLGHIPVPYAGDLNPDAHPEHRGAWPADLYYGDMADPWSDSTVNNTGAARSENRNSPGDGKFDPSSVPWNSGNMDVELEVGRVDFAKLPAFPQTEVELLRKYLKKVHDYRHGILKFQRKALIDDNFGMTTGEPFAVNGWRNFPPLVGASAVAAGDWETALAADSYLWAYGCGSATFNYVSGVTSTQALVTSPNRVAFSMLFGSYCGDWDSEDNILRASLAGDYTLACSWAGRPQWYFHPMGMGATLGYCARVTQNNWLTYPTGSASRQIHVALMGDPTLRLYPVSPASNLVVTASSGGADLAWSTSSDSVVGYHVYVADNPLGPFTRLSSSPVTAGKFSYGGSPTGKTFMVRALKLETTASGRFYNLSQGVFASTGGGAVDVPAVSVTTTNATAAENPQKQGSLQIARSGSTASSLTVSLAISGEAKSGTDYAAIPQTVTIPAGVASVQIPIQPVADDLAEGPETVVVSVLTGGSYTVASEKTATVTIQDAERDDWRFKSFTAEELANPSISSFSADPDSDGVTNLCEYGFLLDPKKGSDTGLPVVSVFSGGGARYLQVAYRRNKQAKDVTFSVEVSSDPSSSWQSGTSFTETLSVTDNGDGSERVVARDRSPLGSTPRRFMRVKLGM